VRLGSTYGITKLNGINGIFMKKGNRTKLPDFPNLRSFMRKTDNGIARTNSPDGSNGIMELGTGKGD
jgi:hypothetical protein